MRTTHARRIRRAILDAKSDVAAIENGQEFIKRLFGTDWEHEAYSRTFENLEIKEGIDYFVSLESRRYFEGYSQKTEFWRREEA